MRKKYGDKPAPKSEDICKLLDDDDVKSNIDCTKIDEEGEGASMYYNMGWGLVPFYGPLRQEMNDADSQANDKYAKNLDKAKACNTKLLNDWEEEVSKNLDKTDMLLHQLVTALKGEDGKGFVDYIANYYVQPIAARQLRIAICLGFLALLVIVLIFA